MKKLIASDREPFDGFGTSVAVSGDTAVVGAVVSTPLGEARRREAEGRSEAGAAYVLQRNQGGPGNWGEVKKLTASDAQDGDEFGQSVAVSGDTAVVAAFRKDDSAGAAYVFQRNEGGADNWGEVTKLTAPDAQAGDHFGRSVEVSGDTAVVGASGAAYVFQRNEGGAGNWGEVTKLTAEAGEFFGRSVAISGDTVIVAAPDLIPTVSGQIGPGAAYVFQRNEGGPGNWGQVTKLTGSDAQPREFFGTIVAISGDTVIVAAPAILVLSGQLGPGAVYVFVRDEGGPGNWGEVKKLTASDPQADDGFGASLAVSGDTAVVGAVFQNTEGCCAGAAYVFQRNEGGADNWGEVTKLTGGSRGNDGFGRVVAVDGDTVVAGATSRGRAPFQGAAYLFDLGLPKPVPPTATPPS